MSITHTDIPEADSVTADEGLFLYEPGLRQVNCETWHSQPNGATRDDVFIIHGHDVKVKNELSSFLEEAKLNPVILEEQPNCGSSTVIEKLIRCSKKTRFFVAIMTPDDPGGRPRPNVLLEIGFVIGKRGRRRLFILKGKGVKVPSDLNGVLYIELDDDNAWKRALAAEMKRAGLNVAA
jgi:predicted nucleotide-binding protein